MAGNIATVIIPIHNEAANLDPLLERLQAVARAQAAWDVSVLFVDDGSTDDSPARLKAWKSRGIPIGWLRLSRNFGHQAALEAGLRHAEGTAVITMDGDLQHPPEEIPRMLAAFEQGADVVQMVRARPVSGSKGGWSRLFYRLFAVLTRTEIIPDAADFRLLSRRVVEVLRQIPERDKFLRALVPSLGFRQVVLAFAEAERAGGAPTFTFLRSFRLARKALWDYSTVPLTLVFWFGMILAIVSFLFGVGHIVVKLLAWEKIVPGFTDIITAVLFLSGCILAALGVLGRYQLTILEQLRGRPTFVVVEHEPAVSSPAPADRP